MTKARKQPNIEYSDVRTSIRDLAKIYKPADAKSFVNSFVNKYNVQKGFETELEAIVLDVIKANGGDTDEV